MSANRTRSILITGCSSGIGETAARVLRERDWRVFATCRKEKDCARLRDEGFESFLIDHDDSATIASGFEETIQRTGGTLDALFNNGAYAIPGAVEDLPVEALRTIFESNFFGWHDLTCRAIRVMRRQGHGRIVQNSSILGFVALPLRGAYNSTKFAVEGLTDTLRLELRGSGIYVILIEPGPIASRFRENAQMQFERWIDREDTVFRQAYDREFQRLALKGPTSRHTLPPGAVVDKVVHALECRRPRARYYVTFPTYMAGFLRRILSTSRLDAFLFRPGLAADPVPKK